MSVPQAAGAPPRIAVLDGLRGLAIGMVVVFHLHQDVPRLWPGVTAFGEQGLVAHLLDFGLLGVDLFYVLSGFFIGSAVLRPAQWAPLAFVKSRLTRILPAYYLSLLLALLLLGVQQPAFFQGLRGWLDVALHLLMLHSFQEWSLFSINGAYWTLGIEFAFYGLMLALAPLWRARSGWLLLGLFALVSLVWRASAWVAVPVEQRYFWGAQLFGVLDEFALGMAVAYARHRRWITAQSPRARGLGLLSAVAGCAVVGAVLAYYVTLPGNYWATGFAVLFSRTLLSLGFALLLVALLFLQQTQVAPAVVRFSGLGWLGGISYSLYLYHTPVIALMYSHGPRWLTPPGLLAATCVAMLGVAWLSYQGVERRWHPSV